MPATVEVKAPPAEIARLADDLFRQEASKLTAILTRRFGIEQLQLAEDVVQEALIRAMQVWPYYGVPSNPAAWLTQTAKNLALDVVRRQKNFRDKQDSILASIERWAAEPFVPEPFFDHEIKDDRLRMMFVACHPVLPEEARVALALKTLCGFGTSEIAKAFLTSEAAVAKRLTRARQRIREEGVAYEIPSGAEAAQRLESVEQTLYLLFNEGYKASSGEELVRAELCFEAIRLTTQLIDHPIGNRPRTHALLALMLLNASRLPARQSPEGELLRLKEQDRTQWNQALIARGMYHLSQSAAGAEISGYHLQAGIAACHCAAPDFAATNWGKILSLYDQWMALEPSPVIALNRAVAVAHLQGAAAGLEAIAAIAVPEQLEEYYFYHVVRGELELQRGEPGRGAEHFRRAQALTDLPTEQLFLRQRLTACAID